MKKYFAFAAAAIMMVACNVEELKTSDVQENGKINLTASINSSEDVTRADGAGALQDQHFVTGKLIQIEAYAAGETTKYTNGVYTTATEGALNPTPDQLYYPANNGAIDICAYYPSTITSGSTSFTVQTNQSTEANYQASDLMYATKLTNCASIVNSQPATHDLTFNHALTKIVVNIVAGNGLDDANITTSPKVSSVKLNNTVVEAQLAISAGVITAGRVTAEEPDPDPEPTDIEILGTGLSNVGIIVPQTVESGKTFITVSYNGANYTYSLSADKTFLAGKVYTYTLTLSARGLVLQATTITNWTSAGEPVPSAITI